MAQRSQARVMRDLVLWQCRWNNPSGLAVPPGVLAVLRNPLAVIWLLSAAMLAVIWLLFNNSQNSHNPLW